MWSRKKTPSAEPPLELEPWTHRNTAYLRLLATPGATLKDLCLLIAAFIAAIAAGVPFPLLGILFGQLVDDFNSASCDATQSTGDTGALSASVNQKVLYILYLTIANWCFIYIHSTCWSMFGERLVRRLREKYLRSLLRQELSFYDQLPAGDVSSRLSNDLDEIQKGTSERVGIVISSISYFVASYIVAFTKSPVLAGILVSLVPAYILMAFLGGHFTTKYSSRYSDEIAKATSIAEEALSKLQIVHAFGAAARLEKTFAGYLGAARVHSLKKSVTAGVQLGLIYFIAYSTNALAYWQGSKSIASTLGTAESSVGAVYTVIFLLIDASFILSRIAPFLQIFGTAVGASRKLNQAIARKSLIDGTDKQKGLKVRTIQDGIEFKDVQFYYPARPSVQILKGLNLSIPANQHTAIVGQSGSGKSTIAALMARLYDPVEGSVRLDGVDLHDLNVRSLRSCFGVVQQDPALLDRSILENIAHGLINSDIPQAEIDFILKGSLAKYAMTVRTGVHGHSHSLSRTISRPTHSRQSSHGQLPAPELQRILARVEKAIDIADARFVDQLPHGLSTSLRVAGKGLSGGQQQRIALARAMVRDPKVLLLDEATSALDSHSERLIQQALENASKGRTTISIAHRLSTIKNADKIVVMHNGEILEQGTHQELIELDGSYAGMVKLQHVDSDSPSASTSNVSEVTVSTDMTDDTVKVELMKDDTVVIVEKIKKEKWVWRKKRESKRGVWSTISGIAKLTRKHWIYLLIAFSASVIVGGSYSGEAVIFGQTISSFSNCRTPESILASGQFWGLLFFILAIVEFFANFFMTSTFGLISEHVLEKVRILSFRTLFNQDAAWHESDGRDASSSLSYITSDANSLAGLTGPVLGTLASVIVSTIAGIVLSMVIAWRIAIVLLACVPILLGSGVMRLRSIARFHEKHAAAFAKATGYATEAVNSIRIISTFSLEDEAVNTYHKALEQPYAETRSMLLWSNAWMSTAYSISNLVYALAYFWGSQNILSGYYTQTQFFIVLPAMLFSAQTCGQLFALAPDFSKSKVSAARILDLLDEGKKNGTLSEKEVAGKADPEPDPELGTEKESGKTSSGRVVFKNVEFSYPSRSTPILRGLDIEVTKKQFVALVGPSGAGKSTIIALVERFYRPSSGLVVAPSRDDIALVPQESVMFEGTVRFNISLGARPDVEASDEDIIEACKAAQIHDTIMGLPDGYETRCGPNGNTFSGGQKQRISIARALLRKPKLLLLDESTSALDSESERMVQEALSKVDCTVIAIAHRLHTIKNADQIFVIEQGRCTARGTHQELLLSSETYRTNAMHQTLDV